MYKRSKFNFLIDFNLGNGSKLGRSCSKISFYFLFVIIVPSIIVDVVLYMTVLKISQYRVLGLTWLPFCSYLIYCNLYIAFIHVCVYVCTVCLILLCPLN